MVEVLITVLICGTIIWVTHKPIRFEIHKKFEDIPLPKQEETEEEKKAREKFEEEQKSAYDGLNEIVQFAQEFVGGGIVEDAQPKQQTK